MEEGDTTLEKKYVTNKKILLFILFYFGQKGLNFFLGRFGYGFGNGNGIGIGFEHRCL